MNEFFFQQPLWLVLLIAPLSLWLRQQRYSPARRLNRFADTHLWRWIISTPDNGKHRQRHCRRILTAMVLAILAISGPFYHDHNSHDELSATDIVLITDISASMAVADVTPNRLQRARLELRKLLTALHGNRMGLIAYAANAYPMLPLTHDLTALQQFIDALDTRLVHLHGSQLSGALTLARDMLGNSDTASRAIILVSDGDIHDDEAALNIARQFGEQGLPLFILATGTSNGGPVPGPGGRFISRHGDIVNSRLDISLLRQLAADSHGLVTGIHDDDSDIDALLGAVRQLHRAAVFQSPSGANSKALFPWLLAGSLLLFLLSGFEHFRTVTLILLSLSLLTPSQQTMAAPWHEYRAYRALQNGDYDTALSDYSKTATYNNHMGAGAAAYRSKKWPLALAHFNHATRLAANDNDKARALYNAANCQLQQGNYDEARHSYQQALILSPHFKKAALNLKLVEEAIRLGHQQENKTLNPRHQATDDRQGRFRTDLSGSESAQRKQQRLSAAIRQWQADKHGEEALGDEQLVGALQQARNINTTLTAVLQQRIAATDQRSNPDREQQPW